MLINRITDGDSISISQINTLLDSGTAWDIEQGKKFLENPDNALFVAYIEERAVGFLTAHRLQRFDIRKAEVLLYEVSVSPEFRRKGIGRALVEKVKEWAKEVGADEVWVLTEKSNLPANALYQSVGGITENPDDVMYVIKL